MIAILRKTRLQNVDMNLKSMKVNINLASYPKNIGNKYL